MFGVSAESEHPSLISHDILFEEFHLCDHDTSTSQTDGLTDGRLAVTVRCVASRVAVGVVRPTVLVTG